MVDRYSEDEETRTQIFVQVFKISVGEFCHFQLIDPVQASKSLSLLFVIVGRHLPMSSQLGASPLLTRKSGYCGLPTIDNCVVQSTNNSLKVFLLISLKRPRFDSSSVKRYVVNRFLKFPPNDASNWQ